MGLITKGMGAIIKSAGKSAGKSKGISKGISKVPKGSFTTWPSEVVGSITKAMPKSKKFKITKKDAFIAGVAAGAVGTSVYQKKPSPHTGRRTKNPKGTGETFSKKNIHKGDPRKG